MSISQYRHIRCQSWRLHDGVRYRCAFSREHVGSVVPHRYVAVYLSGPVSPEELRFMADRGTQVLDDKQDDDDLQLKPDIDPNRCKETKTKGALTWTCVYAVGHDQRHEYAVLPDVEVQLSNAARRYRYGIRTVGKRPSD